ncbi:scavenger receptor cysteine-rich type 1 protein M130 isoform X2 [Xenopus tropicalis]|uniref:Scavenger receptor cysteine-rich type 1 protein M130 isoform X2 n=1 Tax=Xenopus tropicalis TaxID=8364 RepID=A0A8J1JBA9_XENTR|nr:scavenger receptor cysteine-rich type 1 protein M130 isoform X2 [Xenopus tropicalis]
MELALPISCYLLWFINFGVRSQSLLHSSLGIFHNKSWIESKDTCSGVVLLFSNDNFSLACDEHWNVDSPLAQVVCLESGCGTPNATWNLHSSPDSAIEAIQGVQCSGDEPSVGQCRAPGQTVQMCAPERIAAVTCNQNGTDTPGTDIPQNDMATTGTFSTQNDIATPGTYSTQNGPSTPGTYSTQNGPSTPGTYSTQNGPSTPGTYSTQNGPSTPGTYITQNGPSTPGTYSTQNGPSTPGTYSTQNGPSTPGTYSTQNGPSTPGTYSTQNGPSTPGTYSTQNDMATPGTYITQNGTDTTDNRTLRMTGGRTSCDGHVEVLKDNMWRPLCYSGVRENEAPALCQQVGCVPQQPAFTALSKGRRKLPSVAFQCQGNETEFWECDSRLVDICKADLTTYLQCDQSRMQESWMVWLAIFIAVLMITFFCWDKICKTCKCCVDSYGHRRFFTSGMQRFGKKSTRRSIYRRETPGITVQETHSPPSSPAVLENPSEVNALLAPHGFRLNNTITPPPSYMHALKILSRPLENTQTPPPSYLEALKILSRPVIVHVHAEANAGEKEDLTDLSDQLKEDPDRK